VSLLPLPLDIGDATLPLDIGDSHINVAVAFVSICSDIGTDSDVAVADDVTDTIAESNVTAASSVAVAAATTVLSVVEFNAAIASVAGFATVSSDFATVSSDFATVSDASGVAALRLDIGDSHTNVAVAFVSLCSGIRTDSDVAVAADVTDTLADSVTTPDSSILCVAFVTVCCTGACS